jgi:cobalamin biosynthesis protein CbiG
LEGGGCRKDPSNALTHPCATEAAFLNTTNSLPLILVPSPHQNKNHKKISSTTEKRNLNLRQTPKISFSTQFDQSDR